LCFIGKQRALKDSNACAVAATINHIGLSTQLHGMIEWNTEDQLMSTAKIAITIDEQLLDRLDKLVKDRRFASRSRAIQEAVRDKIERLQRTRLARECAKLDPEEEQRWAEIGMARDAELWPEY
jgi:Arc/MetJ-type ribon-helix-helix transcriptional regulator